jgi:hypothetical protein
MREERVRSPARDFSRRLRAVTQFEKGKFPGSMLNLGHCSSLERNLVYDILLAKQAQVLHLGFFQAMETQDGDLIRL